MSNKRSKEITGKTLLAGAIALAKDLEKGKGYSPKDLSKKSEDELYDLIKEMSEEKGFDFQCMTCKEDIPSLNVPGEENKSLCPFCEDVAEETEDEDETKEVIEDETKDEDEVKSKKKEKISKSKDGPYIPRSGSLSEAAYKALVKAGKKGLTIKEAREKGVKANPLLTRVVFRRMSKRSEKIGKATRFFAE